MARIFKIPGQKHSPMRDYMRLVVMLVMLIIVLGMFFSLQSRAPKQPAPPPLAAPESPDAGVPVTPLPPSQPAPQGEQDEAKLLAQVRDDAPIEKTPYYYMLGKIFNMSQQQIESKVDPSILPFDCLAEPKKFRGKFVRFDGSLWRLKETRMNPESGFESVWEGTIARQGPPGREYVYCTVVLTGKPGPEIQPETTNVLFSGVFLKTIVYENQGQPDELGRRNLTKSPLFIGNVLAIASPPQVIGKSESLLYLLLGLAALVVFAYLLLFHHDKGAHERHFEMPSDEDLNALESSSEENQSEESESPSEGEQVDDPDSPPEEEKPNESEPPPEDAPGEDEESSSPNNDPSDEK